MIRRCVVDNTGEPACFTAFSLMTSPGYDDSPLSYNEFIFCQIRKRKMGTGKGSHSRVSFTDLLSNFFIPAQRVSKGVSFATGIASNHYKFSSTYDL
jgi:hypothetical protein